MRRLRRLRRLLTSLALALAVTLSACGNGDDADDDPATPTSTATPPDASPEAEWDGQVEVDFDTGAISAPGFNDLIDAGSPGWAETPLSTASVLLHLDETEGTVETDEETDNGDPVVVVTISELFDDSIEAVRYRLMLVPGDDGLHRFVSGQWAQRCQPDRGQQDFEPEPCL